MRALVLVVMATLVGCASGPRKAETAPSPAPAASPSPTPAASPESTASSGDSNRTFKPPAGWRAKVVDWEVMYCRKGPVGGSRLITELCMTEEQLKEHMAANDEMRRDLERSSRICAADGCTR